MHEYVGMLQICNICHFMVFPGCPVLGKNHKKPSNPLRRSGLTVLKNLQHFCNKDAGNYPKSRQITGNPEGSKKQQKNPQAVAAQGLSLVTRRGFEPRTHCLKGSCSAD